MTDQDPIPQRSIQPITTSADQRARQFEDLVRTERNRERALIIDNETGKAVGDQIIGERTRIIFTLAQLREMWGRVLTHNHPNGWSYPEGDPRRSGAGFSVADVTTFFEFGIAEMRVVTPGYLYRLRLPADSDHSARQWYGRDLSIPIERVFIATNTDLKAEEEAGRITRAERAQQLSHLAMIELQRQWGIEYEREEAP